MSGQRVFVCAITLVAAVGLSTTGGVAAARSTAAVADHVVKIGVLAPLDAGLTEFGQYRVQKTNHGLDWVPFKR